MVEGGNSTVCTSNLTTNATDCYRPFFLGLDKGYDPLYFVLLDYEDETGDSEQKITSSNTHITSNNTNGNGQIWTLEHPAPVVQAGLSITSMERGVGHLCVESFTIWDLGDMGL